MTWKEELKRAWSNIKSFFTDKDWQAPIQQKPLLKDDGEDRLFVVFEYLDGDYAVLRTEEDQYIRVNKSIFKDPNFLMPGDMFLLKNPSDHIISSWNLDE